jgi:hypothetical protein
VPGDDQLYAIDNCVAHARVIWIYNKLVCFKITPEFTVEEEGGLEATVERLADFYV